MPKAVWSHNTSVCRARNFTPFKLMFGAEAIMPEEIKHQSTRTRAGDLLELDRLKAIENLEKYQTEIKAWRDKKVKERVFNIGDLVLLQSPRAESLGKLQPKWQGPYLATKESRPGSYRLSDSEGGMLPHSRHADNLRCFYI
jgi:hypothetical protein